MYAAIRQAKAKPGMADELARRVKRGAISIISSVPGFLGYYVVYAPDERVKSLVTEEVWRRRYHMINEFEHMLALNRTTILKFFLHISKDEQKRRLQSRLDDQSKDWKFSSADIRERAYW